MSNTKPKRRFARTFTLSDEAQEKLSRIAAIEMRSRSMVLERLILDSFRNYVRDVPATATNKAVKQSQEAI